MKAGRSRRRRAAEQAAEETASLTVESERAILVALELRNHRNPWSLEDTLRELAYLTETAGAEVVGQITQRSARYAHTYVGKGKLEEINELVAETEAVFMTLPDPAEMAVSINIHEADIDKIAEGMTAVTRSDVQKKLQKSVTTCSQD